MSAARQALWSPDIEVRVGSLLTAVQGRRAARLLTIEQVRACAMQAAGTEVGLAWCHGGQSGDVRGLTTVCLCVATDGGVVVGLSAARAQDVTPARAFRDLSTWDRYEDALNRAPAARWAAKVAVDRVLVPWAKVAASEGPAAFLAAIAQAPGADEPRLVYADWLSERGDPRGEFISVQCALARGVADESEARALRERERQLLTAHADSWLAGLPSRASVVHRFERGFVSMLRVTAADAVAGLGPFIEQEGVWRLVLACPVPSSLLVASWLPRLRALEFWGHGGLSAAMLEQLLSSRALQHLEALLIREQQSLAEAGIRTLAERGSAVFSSLRAFQLEDAHLTPAQLQVLASTRWFAELESLSLVDNPLLGAAGASVLASTMKRLQTLRLDGTRLGNEGVKVLALAARLKQLSYLSIDRNRVTAEGAKALLESDRLPSLRRVSVEGNHLGRAMRAKLDAKYLT